MENIIIKKQVQKISSDKKTTNESEKYWTLNNSFQAALTLLRANIIVLCIRVGMEPMSLWPSQAILLNLSQFHLYLIQQIKLLDFTATTDEIINSFNNNNVSCSMIYDNNTKNEKNNGNYSENR